MDRYFVVKPTAKNKKNFPTLVGRPFLLLEERRDMFKLEVPECIMGYIWFFPQEVREIV